MIIDNMTKNIFKRSVMISIIILLIMLFFSKEPGSYLQGYVFGFLVSNLTFRLLVNSSKKVTKMHPANAERYATKQYMIRMAIYFLVMLIAAKADYLNILATFVGLVITKIVIVISTIFKWEL